MYSVSRLMVSSTSIPCSFSMSSSAVPESARRRSAASSPPARRRRRPSCARSRRAAEELGCRPNILSRSLTTGRSRIIGPRRGLPRQRLLLRRGRAPDARPAGARPPGAALHGRADGGGHRLRDAQDPGLPDRRDRARLGEHLGPRRQRVPAPRRPRTDHLGPRRPDPGHRLRAPSGPCARRCRILCPGSRCARGSGDPPHPVSEGFGPGCGARAPAGRRAEPLAGTDGFAARPARPTEAGPAPRMEGRGAKAHPILHPAIAPPRREAILFRDRLVARGRERQPIARPAVVPVLTRDASGTGVRYPNDLHGKASASGARGAFRRPAPSPRLRRVAARRLGPEATAVPGAADDAARPLQAARGVARRGTHRWPRGALPLPRRNEGAGTAPGAACRCGRRAGQAPVFGEAASRAERYPVGRDREDPAADGGGPAGCDRRHLPRATAGRRGGGRWTGRTRARRAGRRRTSGRTKEAAWSRLTPRRTR